MVDLLVAVVFLSIFVVALAAALGICALLYRDFQVPSPLRLLAASFERLRGGIPSSLPLVMRSLRKGLAGAYIPTVQGGRVVPRDLQVSLAPEDVAELDRQRILDDLPDWIGDTLGITASRGGWSGMRGSVAVWMLEDPACHPNRPQVVTGRPRRPGSMAPRVVTMSGPSIGADLDSGGGSRLDRPAVDATTPMADPGAENGAYIAGQARPGPAEGRPAAAADAEATMTSRERALIVREGRIECRVTDRGVRIGRDERSDLVVRDHSVSREHAAVNYRAGELVLEPIEGRLCWVNGVSVAGATMLHFGDVMRFSNSPLDYHIEAGRP